MEASRTRPLPFGLEAMQEKLAGAFRDGADNIGATFQLQMDRMAEHLQDIRRSVDRLEDTGETLHWRESGIASAAGILSLKVGMPAAGHIWQITRACTVVLGGAATTAAIYREEISPVNAVHLIPDADFFADGLNEPVHIPPQVPVFVEFNGAPNAAQIMARLQITELPA